MGRHAYWGSSAVQTHTQATSVTSTISAAKFASTTLVRRAIDDRGIQNIAAKMLLRYPPMRPAICTPRLYRAISTPPPSGAETRARTRHHQPAHGGRARRSERDNQLAQLRRIRKRSPDAGMRLNSANCRVMTWAARRAASGLRPRRYCRHRCKPRAAASVTTTRGTQAVLPRRRSPTW
jgi:hypothetical protein